MKPPKAPKSEMHIVQLLPNLLTLAAICAGLTAIRFGIEGNFERAVKLILLAGVLDGVDGRVARLLKSESLIGAELDSLADFVNFGVAPMLLIYLWGLQDMRNEAWIAMLLFSVCCVIRLARFNVGARAGADVGENRKEKKADFFTGIPSPAGAILAMLPMYLYFLWGYRPTSQFADVTVCAWVVFVGLMMISRVPTFALKKVTIARTKVRYFMIGFVFFIAALLTYTWLTLAVCSLIYLATIPFSIRAAGRAPQPSED
ncbi:CDP-diacylglycerol--serine O-phosphatidyltransferase [Oceaniglobus trochenteri]|uniref:CDP-diacylglycerol--serine O-phosphatidyltransferase n=1 Tax=Oceaniglobus trochenteri TaxID=2763260 RepID=UPI001CFFF829|nr:CDP-diacylglycerol--serine O-phosphatidyltransferase [Oceaniglobus trochenteri]